MNTNSSTENASRENQIDLHRLMEICREHAKLFILWTVIMGIVGFVVAEFVITPQYTASTQILVNQKRDNADGQAYNNQQADIQVINTYKDIITNQVILSKPVSRWKIPFGLLLQLRRPFMNEMPMDVGSWFAQLNQQWWNGQMVSPTTLQPLN